ncbi:MAG: hypothetical protein IH986_17000 [Planctomycetes bacterium]|nr:hypothetical protein [Planctomycetota bacterium]
MIVDGFLVDLNDAARAVLAWVGQAILLGTALALITGLLVRYAFRRVHAVWHGVLWLIVLIKFILPVGPALTVSMATSITALSALIPFAAISAAEPVDANVAGFPATWIPVTGAAAPISESVFAKNRELPVALLFGCAYVLGVAIVATVRCRAHLRLRAECRRLPLADESTRGLVAGISQRFGLRRAPTVRMSNTAPAPFILGVLRPTLVLSHRQLKHRRELEAVVLHEIAHLRRGDLLVRYLQWFAGTILFFWPVVAWVNRRIDLARESVCDEWALRHGPLTPGQYARCLLGAVRPARSSWSGVAPASMAANVFTVERRIEMILNVPAVRRNRRWVKLPLFLLVAGWAAFALSGAQATDEKAAQDKPAQGEHAIIVLQPADGDETGNAHWVVRRLGRDSVQEVADIAWPQGVAYFVSDDAEGAHAVFQLHTEVGAQALARLFEQHPAADSNGDGKVARVEHDAFLIAAAMTDPAAVLAQFPKADRDENGELSASEAARLMIGGASPTRVRFRVLHRATGDEGGEEAGELHRIELNEHQKALLHRVERPAAWVLHNIQADLTSEDVASYVTLARETPNAVFLEMNPKADANGDGKLTADEREAFSRQLMSRRLSRVLERHPEADLDGDGTLTKQELHDFCKNQAVNGTCQLRQVEGGSAGVFILNGGQGGVLVQLKDGSWVSKEDEPK